MEPQLTGSVSKLQTFEELATKDLAENSLRQKEARVSGMHPVRVITRKTAGGHDAVSMWMMLQLLIPAVEHAEETDLGPKVPGICSDLDQSLGAGAEEQPVDHFFVLQRQRGQLMGEREDDMRIGHRQQFGAPRFQPAVARLALTLRAVPVTA